MSYYSGVVTYKLHTLALCGLTGEVVTLCAAHAVTWSGAALGSAARVVGYRPCGLCARRRHLAAYASLDRSGWK